MSRRGARRSAAAAPAPAALLVAASIVPPPVKRPWQLAGSSALFLAWILFLAVMAIAS